MIVYILRVHEFIGLRVRFSRTAVPVVGIAGPVADASIVLRPREGEIAELDKAFAASWRHKLNWKYWNLYYLAYS